MQQDAAGTQGLGVRYESARSSVIAFDLAAIVLCFVGASFLRYAAPFGPVWQSLGGSPVPSGIAWDRNDAAFLVFQALAIPVLLYATGQYRMVRDPSATWSFNRVVASVGACFAGLFVLLFVLGIHGIPRIFTTLDFVFLVWTLAAWRTVYERRAKSRLTRGIGLRHVLMVGVSPLMSDLADHMMRDPLSGRRILGFLSTGPGSLEATTPREGVLQVEHASLTISEAAALLAKEQPRHFRAAMSADSRTEVTQALDGLGIEEVFIGPEVGSEITGHVLRACQARGVDVHIVPEHHAELGIRPQPWTLGPYTLLDIHRRPFSRLGATAKRGMDILGGVVGLLLFSPIIILTSLAIKIENPREPIFYPATRVGLKGRHFRMAKFTTMRPDAQEIEKQMMKENQREGPWFKLEAENDPRLTRVGRFIRKYSINEVPQFWNVLTGDMSLVGPRPPIPDEVASYVEYDFRYFRCLDVRPGITGLWQVTCKNDPSFDRRIDLDIQYIREWHLWMDVKILVKTLWTVVAEPEE